MRLRQTPMIEASALMGISLLVFLLGLWVIEGDIAKVLGNGPILAALLLFPSYVLWALFAKLATDAKPFTRFLIAVAITLAIAAGGAFLMQPGSEFSASQQQQAIMKIAAIVLDFAFSGVLASALVYGWLIRDRKGSSSTLLTAPVVANTKKKKRK